MIKGIDVSEYQGNIDWAKVKEDGVAFAIIRAGFGKNNVDKRFEANVKGCIANNIPFGVYWFIYGLNDTDILANASKFNSVISPYKAKISMKVWSDFEYDTDAWANKNGVVFDKAKRTSMVRVFNEYMKSLGYEVGVYANPDYLNSKFNNLSDYPLWLAFYGTTEDKARKYNPTMWQYSSKGKVNGIKGDVDMNNLFEELKLKEVLPMLQKGSTGKAVKVWQVIIGATPDGVFGNDTKRLTKDFQKSRGLLVDGIVGNQSWEAGLKTLYNLI